MNVKLDRVTPGLGGAPLGNLFVQRWDYSFDGTLRSIYGLGR